MRIRLSVDIPKEYNDMSEGKVAKLAIELKKLVNDLNFYLNEFDSENFSDEYNRKMAEIENALSDLKERTKAIEDKLAET
jgi:hypothetical protein